MKFYSFLALLASLWTVGCEGASPAITDLHSITQLNQNLTTTLANTSGATDIAQVLVSGYKNISSQLYQNAKALGAGTQTYSLAEQQQLCSAYQTYAATFQNVLQSTTGQAGNLQNVKLSNNVHSVLQITEFAEAAYAKALTAVTPSCAANVKPEFNTLEQQLMAATKMFSSS